MRMIVLTMLAAMTLASCAQQSGPRRGGPTAFAKNPSVILALDIAQNREAQETGAYAALLDTAADNAVTFVPEPVEARPGSSLSLR